MVDTLTPQARSELMARVRSKDTKPELIVRRLLHSMGYRYRLHGQGLPGRPDLVFPRRRKAIQVHGCFWHGHQDPACKLARAPRSRMEYWLPKLTANRERDERNERALAAAGWDQLTIWECQLQDTNTLATVLRGFLDPADPSLTAE